MLTRIAEIALRYPMRVLGVAGILLVLGAIFGAPVAAHLKSGGFTDPSADSTKATNILDKSFHGGQSNLVFLVTASGGADSAAAKTVGTDIEAGLRQRTDWITFTQSYWSAPKAASAALRSKDGKYGLVVAHIKGNDNEIQIR